MRGDARPPRNKVTGGAGAVNKIFGTTQVIDNQLGFVAELTSSFNASTGYQWKRLAWDPVTKGYVNPPIQIIGQLAFTPDDDRTLVSGIRGWMELDPDKCSYVFIPGGEGGGGGSLTPCEDYGWTVDREPLVNRDGNDPKGVFTFRMDAGKVGGRCECIPKQPFDDADPPIHLFYDIGSGKWLSSEYIKFCCGCALLEVDIPTDATREAALPNWTAPMLAKFYITNTCSPGGAGTYYAQWMCGGPTYHKFAVGGAKLCDGDITPPPNIPCEHHAIFTITCDECSLENPECDECKELCVFPIFRITTVGFTGSDSVYNGANNTGWLLPWVGMANNCKWEIVCGGITVTATMYRDGSFPFQSHIKVTYSGGGGGGATYIYDEPLTGAGDGQNITCWAANHVLARTAGNPATTPATITQTLIACVGCTDKCGSVDCFNLDSDVVSDTGTCGPLSIAQDPGSARCVLNLPDGWSAAFDVTITVPGRTGEIEVTCFRGRITVEFHSSGGPAFTHSLTVLSVEWDPFVLTFRFDFSQGGCSSSFIIVISQGS